MDDWQTGDLAMCIIDEWSDLVVPVPGPAKGSVNTVVGVHSSWCPACRERHDWLDLQGWYGWWAAGQFTKIRPLTEEEKREALEEIEQDKRVPVETN